MRFKNIAPFQKGDRVHYRYCDGEVATDKVYIVKSCFYRSVWGKLAWYVSIEGYTPEWESVSFVKVTEVCQS